MESAEEVESEDLLEYIVDSMEFTTDKVVEWTIEEALEVASIGVW